VVCLAPRVPEEIVGPRRLSGVVVQPLNFTVRRQQAVPWQSSYTTEPLAPSFRVVRGDAQLDSAVQGGK
jgi:hypothetical protein